MQSYELPVDFSVHIMNENFFEVFGFLFEQTLTPHQMVEALNTAILCGKDEIAFALLTKIINVNDVDHDQYSPLQMATSMSNLPMVEKLVSRGATINLEDKDTLQPILNAILAQNIKIVEFLIYYGAKMTQGEQHMLETTFDKDSRTLMNRLYLRIQWICSIQLILP